MDDSEDDGEYVPTLKELKQAGVSDGESKDIEEKVLTGIALLKDQKRQREVDDLFELMNQEDDFVSKTKR